MAFTWNASGSCEILEQIGAGGMGEVYCARDTRLGRDVAVKALAEKWGRSPIYLFFAAKKSVSIA